MGWGTQVTETKEEKVALKEGIQLSIHVMLQQLQLHAENSQGEKLKNSDVRSVTDIAKTLTMIDKNLKENPDEPTDIMSMTAEEIRKEAERIMGLK